MAAPARNHAGSNSGLKIHLLGRLPSLDSRAFVSVSMTLLTHVPISVTIGNLAHKGRRPVTRLAGARVVPAGGGCHLRSRAVPGKRPAGMMTGLRRKSLDWDRREWVTPVLARRFARAASADAEVGLRVCRRSASLINS
jgi:hypothetical protein